MLRNALEETGQKHIKEELQQIEADRSVKTSDLLIFLFIFFSSHLLSVSDGRENIQKVNRLVTQCVTSYTYI